jgi:hypothetical protein
MESYIEADDTQPSPRARARKGGSKLKRENLLQLRVDDRVKFAAELGARAQIRTVATYIESCIEMNAKVLQINHLVSSSDFLEVNDNEPIFLSTLIKRIWHTNEKIRFMNLAQAAPLLLSAEEKNMWHIIKSAPYFWKTSANTGRRLLNKRLVRRLWSYLIEADDVNDIPTKEVHRHLLAISEASKPEQIAQLQKLLFELCPEDEADE